MSISVQFHTVRYSFRGSLSISDDPALHNDPIIILNNFPNALYHKQDDVLYFQKLDSIKLIFNNIDSLYREATQEEVKIIF